MTAQFARQVGFIILRFAALAILFLGVWGHLGDGPDVYNYLFGSGTLYPPEQAIIREEQLSDRLQSLSAGEEVTIRPSESSEFEYVLAPTQIAALYHAKSTWEETQTEFWDHLATGDSETAAQRFVDTLKGDAGVALISETTARVLAGEVEPVQVEVSDFQGSPLRVIFHVVNVRVESGQHKESKGWVLARDIK